MGKSPGCLHMEILGSDQIRSGQCVGLIEPLSLGHRGQMFGRLNGGFFICNGNQDKKHLGFSLSLSLSLSYKVLPQIEHCIT